MRFLNKLLILLAISLVSSQNTSIIDDMKTDLLKFNSKYVGSLLNLSEYIDSEKSNEIIEFFLDKLLLHVEVISNSDLLTQIQDKITNSNKNKDFRSKEFLQSQEKTMVENFMSMLFKDNDFHQYKSELISSISFIIETANDLTTENPFLQDTFLCKPCHYVMYNFDSFARKKLGFKVLKSILALGCSMFMNKEVCFDSINRYGDIVYDSILDHYLDSEFICSLIFVCKNHYVPLNSEDYAREVLKDKPKVIDEPSFPSNSTLKILHLSDMHIDVYYKENSESDCGKPMCCREEKNKSNKDINSPSGYWGSLAKCDLPLRTLSNMINNISEELKPDIILWTGDNGSHDVWNLAEDTAAIATRIVGEELFKNLTSKNNVPLYPAIGNHEERTVDLFNPYNLTYEEPLLKNITEVYSKFIDKKKAHSFLKRGYYSSLYKDNLRIIALNCFLCDAVNFYLIKNPTDPLAQIEFLRETLHLAEQNNEIVYIIGHIPPGDETFLTECNKRYNVIMERFQNIIRGQFYGHTHNDEIRLIKSFQDEKKHISAVYIAPSTTTYSYQNPAYRYFEADPETYYLKNYYQYRLNLTKANENPEKKLDWELIYDFNSFYNTKHLYDYSNMNKFIKNLKDKENTFYLKYLKNYFSAGPLYDKYIDSELMKTCLYCKASNDNFHDLSKCTKYRFYNEDIYAGIFNNVLSGKWYYKEDHNDTMISSK